jgi:hypothetical protein
VSDAAMTMITVMTAGKGRHHCIRRILVCRHFSQSPHTGQSGPHDSHGNMFVRLAVWSLESLASSSSEASLNSAGTAVGCFVISHRLFLAFACENDLASLMTRRKSSSIFSILARSSVLLVLRFGFTLHGIGGLAEGSAGFAVGRLALIVHRHGTLLRPTCGTDPPSSFLHLLVSSQIGKWRQQSIGTLHRAS